MYSAVELNQGVVVDREWSSEKIERRRSDSFDTRQDSLLKIKSGASKPVQGSSEKIERRRSVSFDTTRNSLHEVENFASKLVQEHYWVTKDEFQLTKRRDSFLCELASAGRIQDDDQHSVRGLESRIRRAERSYDSIVHSILREQKIQKRKGENCSVSLSLLYSRASQKARFDAFRLGLQDAHEALLYQKRA